MPRVQAPDPRSQIPGPDPRSGSQVRIPGPFFVGPRSASSARTIPIWKVRLLLIWQVRLFSRVFGMSGGSAPTDESDAAFGGAAALEAGGKLIANREAVLGDILLHAGLGGAH